VGKSLYIAIHLYECRIYGVCVLAVDYKLL